MADLGEVARRFVQEVWNGEREESVYELLAPDLVESSVAFHRDRRTSFPDQRYEIVTVIAEEDRVAIRWRGSGTQHGQFGPVPPTGRQVEYSGATFLRFDAEGRIAEVWSVNELFQVLQQLGVQTTMPEGLASDS